MAPRLCGSPASLSAAPPPDSWPNSSILPLASLLGLTMANTSRPTWFTNAKPKPAPTRARSSHSRARRAQGIGVRVIVDGKQGFAYAGTLDDDALQETLREARDNATFAEPDEFNGVAEPDGVAPAARTVELDAPGPRSRPRTRSPSRSNSSGPRSQPIPASPASSRPNTSTRLRVGGRHQHRHRSCWPARPAAICRPTRWRRPMARSRPALASRSVATHGRSIRAPQQAMRPNAQPDSSVHRSRQVSGSRSCTGPVGHRPVPRHRRPHPHWRRRSERPVDVRRADG
jgi:hypothetical protein